MGERNCSRKLMVEVCNAKKLMPKDGQGTASGYALVDFNSQRRRTTTKVRDLEILKLNIYNDEKAVIRRSTYLGKVKISESTFVKSGSEALVYYPLEKRSVFSQIKGEVCISDRQRPRKRQKANKKIKGKEWLFKKKEHMRRKGHTQPPDTRYSGRKRKAHF